VTPPPDEGLALFLAALDKTPQCFHARGGSMAPAIPDGTPLRLTRPAGRRPHLGDVVAVAPGPLIVHRVVGIRDDEAGASFLLQGDALPRPDGWYPLPAIEALVHTTGGDPLPPPGPRPAPLLSALLLRALLRALLPPPRPTRA
jgi:hypothetical protein